MKYLLIFLFSSLIIIEPEASFLDTVEFKEPHQAFAKYLIRKGQKINQSPRSQRIAFFEAVRSGDIKKLKKMIKDGFNINQKSKMQRTALHLSVKNGLYDISEFLIKNGIRIQAKDKYGRTALHVSVFDHRPKITELLLKNGAKPNVKDRSGESPLHYAFEYNQIVEYNQITYYHDLLDTVRLLVEYGADVNLRNEKETPALFYLASFGKITGKQELKAAKIILENGFNINTQNTLGNSLVHLAVLFKNDDLVRFCIKNRADLNQKNKKGQTALHLASELDSMKLMSFLVKNGARIKERTKDGDTALHYAAKENRVSHMKFLLTYGADPHTRNSLGQTAFDLLSTHYPKLEAENQVNELKEFLRKNRSRMIKLKILPSIQRLRGKFKK